ncbi:MAG: pseudouridylate synthase [Deltaproteobacteria bacterium HGW-Deltaproteobacteria-17]|nr:MAG: pseudouridylate synthase [Deltaproteobacteria bacterium HGW-Deltaproteobacteria-17]
MIPKPSGLPPEGLNVLYLDDFLVAVDKPAGLLVHRSEIDRHETHFALQMVRDLLGRRVFPVHRLDKPTSGVLLFALDPVTARMMGDLFTTGGITKTYLAVVRGWTPEALVIDHPLVEEDLTPRADGPAPPAREAITHLERLATVELPFPAGPHPTCRCSLVRLTPKTGRRHQLRRHMKHIFHPIVGDTTHGDGRINALFRAQFACSRLLLAAVSFGFVHPHTGRTMEIRAPLDPAFLGLLTRLGWVDEVDPTA